jgi:hypothetical protein
VKVRVWKDMDELPSPFIGLFFMEPTEGEVAVERGDQLFYIRVARRGEFIMDASPPDFFVALFLLFLRVIFVDPIRWWYSKQPFKIAIIRTNSKKGLRWRCVYKQMLARTEDPAPLVDELLARILDGEFDEKR